MRVFGPAAAVTTVVSAFLVTVAPPAGALSCVVGSRSSLADVAAGTDGAASGKTFHETGRSVVFGYVLEKTPLPVGDGVPEDAIRVDTTGWFGPRLPDPVVLRLSPAAGGPAPEAGQHWVFSYQATSRGLVVDLCGLSTVFPAGRLPAYVASARAGVWPEAAVAVAPGSPPSLAAAVPLPRPSAESGEAVSLRTAVGLGLAALAAAALTVRARQRRRRVD